MRSRRSGRGYRFHGGVWGPWLGKADFLLIVFQMVPVEGGVKFCVGECSRVDSLRTCAGSADGFTPAFLSRVSSVLLVDYILTIALCFDPSDTDSCSQGEG